MRIRLIGGIAWVLLLVPSLSPAQLTQDEEGFELGSIRIVPVTELLGAYDNRVLIAGDGDAEGDFYSEIAALLYFENNPARFDFSADVGYGYRFYREYTDLDNDFYDAGAALAYDNGPVTAGLSSYLKKTLDYDTRYDASSGTEPGAILTGNPSTRYTVMAYAAYEKEVTDRATIEPRYDVWHYFQDFEGEGDAEWQEHQVSLRLGYDYTGKTTIFLTGYYNRQTNDDEDGAIGAMTVGAEGSFSDKLYWLAEVGYAAADYELSGADQGMVGAVRARWVLTEKVSAYIYGRSDFQPGYGGGGANRIYRLGYGATWRFSARWETGAEILHDYLGGIGDATGSDDEVRNFITTWAEYDLTRRLAIRASVRYIMDEEVTDQMIAALNAIYRF